MLIVESMIAGHDKPWTVALGDAVHDNDDIEEQGTADNNTNDYSCWNSLEW